MLLLVVNIFILNLYNVVNCSISQLENQCSGADKMHYSMNEIPFIQKENPQKCGWASDLRGGQSVVCGWDELEFSALPAMQQVDTSACRN